MKLSPFLSLLLLLSALAAPVIASPTIEPEAGVSYFVLRHTQIQPGAVTSVDEPTATVPFVAVTGGFTDHFGLRLSYHYLRNVDTVTRYNVPPGSLLQILVWGHYEDDVHLFSAAPEFKWSLAPRVMFAIAPEVNWVASKGMISYSTNGAALTLVAPQTRNDHGFTLGGSTRLVWSLGRHAAVALGYQYVDLDPSFGRVGHVFSGSVQWEF